jgi:hypothetical protein
MKKAQTCAREEVPGATQGIPAWAHRQRARRRRSAAPRPADAHALTVREWRFFGRCNLFFLSTFSVRGLSFVAVLPYLANLWKTTSLIECRFTKVQVRK